MALKLTDRGGYWQITGTLEGERVRRSTGFARKDKRAAEQHLVEIQPEILKEIRDRKAGQKQKGPLTFAEAAVLYLKAGKQQRFVGSVVEYWKETPVRNITSGKVREAAIVMYPNATGGTRNRHVIVPTQAIINHAADLELCSFLKVKRFKVEEKVKTPVTWDWVQAFMAAANPHIGALAAFMFLTGARISEALALRWRDVDLERAVALIRQTKVAKERAPHLPPELVAAIDKIEGDRDPDAKVFKYSTRNTATPQWEAVIKRAKIKRLSFHCCRHGFATTLLHRGVDPVTVAKLGGWADAQLVLKTYGHAMSDPTISELLTQNNGTLSSHNLKKTVKTNVRLVK